MCLLDLCQGMAPAFFVSGEMCAGNVNEDKEFREFFQPGPQGCLVTDQGGYRRMSVLMGIQGGIQYKKFIPAACAQWGGIRHTGLFTAATKAAVGSRMRASLLSCAFFMLRCGCPVLELWVCPAFTAFWPEKEAGHEDEVQEDAHEPEGQLLL